MQQVISPGEQYIRELEQENNLMAAELMARGENNPLPPASAAMFSSNNKQNLVEWQLDFRPELKDIEHLLRCDIYVINEKTGKEGWIKNPDKGAIFLNDLGVNDVIREVRMFLNKNTVLSNYHEDSVSERIRQFGHELRALIYNNAEKYGIDNEYKENNYSIIVITILAMVESAYRRAINGEERRDLNSARIVQQSEQSMAAQMPYGMLAGVPQQKKATWYNPFTWGR